MRPPNIKRHRVGQTAGDYMRGLRESTGKTQGEWSALVGCSIPKICRIETNWHGFDYATQYLWECTAHAS